MGTENDKSQINENKEENANDTPPDIIKEIEAGIVDKVPEIKPPLKIEPESPDKKSVDNIFFIGFYRNDKKVPWSFFNKACGSRKSLKSKLDSFIAPKIVHIEEITLPE